MNYDKIVVTNLTQKKKQPMTKDRETTFKWTYKDTTYATFIRKHILEVYPDKVDQFTDEHLYEAIKTAMDRFDSLFFSIPVDVIENKRFYEPIFALYKELSHEETKVYCKKILNPIVQAEENKIPKWAEREISNHARTNIDTRHENYEHYVYFCSRRGVKFLKNGGSMDDAIAEMNLYILMEIG